MKINFKRLFAAAAAVCLLSCAWAQVTVVKQDGNKIYLDTSVLNRNVAVGETFKIITSQEKLTNPKTGKDLGFINHYSPEGKIIEVQSLYAVGEMQKAAKYQIGAEAVITAREPAALQAKAAPYTAAEEPVKTLVSSRKINTWPVIDAEIISAVKTDLSALPGEEIATLDTKGTLTVYANENNTLRALTSHQLPAWQTPLALSALDVKKSGAAQLFAAVYDTRTQQIYTLVFDASNGEITSLGKLPYFAKELGCGKNKEIYVQKPFVSGTKAGKAYELTYKKGRFATDDDSFATHGHWLTGVNYYEIQNNEKDNFVYTAPNGKIRLQLANGKYIESPALFAGAPNRVKYKQDILSFYPSLQVYGPDGHATLAGVENVTKSGLLSEQFGQYDSSKIHFLTYENGRFTVQETVTLDGFLYDTNCTQYGILAPQIVSGGQTILTEIYR